MAKVSAGILLYRRVNSLEVFLIHPGGPYFARKDAGSWSIPKGELEGGEENDKLGAALREFSEETGLRAPAGHAQALKPVRLKSSGKWIYAWAVEGDADPAALHSNTFEMEWPPKSGRIARFPEADRADWFSLPDARLRIHPAQAVWLDELEAYYSSSDPGGVGATTIVTKSGV
jgi:predicted NUDIX family NTP pyrophosphohydrolase